MSQEKRINLAAFIGTHGEEMEIGGRLLQKLRTNPIHSVNYRIAHPQAVKAEKRYIEPGSQLTGHYPGTPHGDPQQRAAYANMQWLQTVNPTVVVDIHETNIPGEFIEVSETPSRAALGVGVHFGYQDIVISGSPFYQYVSNGVAIEHSLAENDPEISANRLYEGLQNLAPRDLRHLPIRFDELKFYNEVDVMTLNQEGTLSHGLSDLEAIPHAERFSPLDLPRDIRKLFGIDLHAEVFYGTWGHNNMSLKKPERLGYTEAGIPRSECFGSIYIATSPPKETSDGFLIFSK